MRFGRLLAVDRRGGGGGEAVERASELARREGGRLHVVACAAGRGAGPAGDLAAAASLARRAGVLREMGLEVTTAVLSGEREDAILDEARRCRADLVVDEIERRPSLLSRLARGGQRRLVRNAPCPVWLVAEQARPGGPVVVGVNPHDEGSPAADLDRRLLEAGRAFARALGAELRVVHAWSFDVMPVLGRVSVDPERNRHAAIEAHHAAAERLARFLASAPFSIPRRNVHLLVGDPALLLQAVAAELHADVLIVGSVERGSVPDLVSGHLEERVLSELSCSLVVVKPAASGDAAGRGRADDLPAGTPPPT